MLNHYLFQNLKLIEKSKFNDLINTFNITYNTFLLYILLITYENLYSVLIYLPILTN